MSQNRYRVPSVRSMLVAVVDDFDSCYRAVRSRDPRFDGWFFTAVRTTGIYCRPSCPATTPHRENVTFYPTAAAAQQAGYRACKRCRPDAAPGSPEWDLRGDVVARAMRLIADGVVDREGVPGLGLRLGYSTRQVERLLRAEVGAPPLALARAQRAQTARVLLETTDLPVTQVAFAAGFASVRQFNDTVRAVFAMTPSELRARRRAARSGAAAATPDPGGGGPQTIRLRLPYRAPLSFDHLLAYLAARAVPGVEEVAGGVYRRVLDLPGGPGLLAVSDPAAPGEAWLSAEITLVDLRDLTTAIARARRLLDLDADPAAVDAELGVDRSLAALVADGPGRRVPRTVDEQEMAVRAVLGQQVSLASARASAARLAAALGRPVADPLGRLTRSFPTAGALAGAPGSVAGLPGARRAAVAALAEALASGRIGLGPGADRAEARAALAALPGVGPWTVEVIAMRALGDPDAFPATDLGLLRAAGRAGLPVEPPALVARSAAWRPWRAYAAQYLIDFSPPGRASGPAPTERSRVA